MIEIGAKYCAEETVTDAATAASVGSGGLCVYATPRMAALMENAAYNCLAPMLAEGKTSVGTALDISHVSATPVGMRVTAEAELAAVSENGKIVDFKLTARDETGIIGEGTHRRVIVDTERFLAKCEAKREK